jgi:hypothetical protein
MNEVWYVVGETDSPTEWPTLFDTKMGAEEWARCLFPNEHESKRYARIFYRRVETQTKEKA